MHDRRLDSGDVVPSAFLRVFQPLDAFEREEQAPLGALPARRARAPVAPPALRRTTDTRGVAGAPGARRRRARRGPGGRRTDVREPVAACACGSWPRCSSFREAEPMELCGAVRAEEGRQAARPASWRGSAAATRGAVSFVPPESVARADPVVRAVRRRGAVAERATSTVAPVCATAPRRGGRCGAPSRRSVPLRRSDLGPISDLILDLHQWMARVRSGVAPGARLRALCDFMTGTSWTTTTASRDCTRRSTRWSATSTRGRRHLPGRAEPTGPRSAAARS